MLLTTVHEAYGYHPVPAVNLERGEGKKCGEIWEFQSFGLLQMYCW